ncbi:MAG: phospholipase D-like domain-containing protein, partial [Anaerolineae bacterium]|nr:phospholipase D-like domain-containing protein [Anaerolineae bacterium]
MKTRFLTLLILLLAACIPPLPAEPTSSSSSDWYSLYFSRPDLPASRSYRGGPDTALAEAIDAARASVDLAIHDLDLWSLRDALIDAHRRGLDVRLVVESENIRVPEIQQLIQTGLPVVEDRNLDRMHNKFAVIDRYEVWTGSMNFTVNGAYRNDNNLIRIRSSRLAENFTAEFEEMFLDGRYSDRSPADTPFPALNIDGSLVETFFAPEDRAAARIVELIDGAQESIHFMAFSLTSDPIAAALLDAYDRGVEIIGVF